MEPLSEVSEVDSRAVRKGFEKVAKMALLSAAKMDANWGICLGWMWVEKRDKMTEERWGYKLVELKEWPSVG